MAKVSVAQLKLWFKKGLKPTQAQFWDWLDSYFHKDDKIPISVVENLQETLDALAGASPGGMATVIDMKPGEYLSDIITSITDASEAKPYTINFYNHSKTVDLLSTTEKIVWPRHVYLNIVGDQGWYKDASGLPPYSDYDLFPKLLADRQFIGFDFSRTNENSYKLASGLPSNLRGVVFGTIEGYMASETYESLMQRVQWEIGGPIGLVSCGRFNNENYEREYTENDGKVYKILSDRTTAIDLTTDFSNCNLVGFDFSYSISRCVDFTGALLMHSNFDRSILNEANFKGADCTGADFRQAYLYKANCEDTVFTNIDFRTTSFNHVVFKNAIFGSCNFDRVGMSMYAKGSNFSYSSFKNSRFFGIFDNASFENADFTGVEMVNTLYSHSSFLGTNFTGVKNLPESLDTKAKFIAVVGVDNVNEATIWIDGTSILS